MFAYRSALLTTTLLASACASLPNRENPADAEFVIVVRNDSPENVIAFLVVNREDGMTLGPVRTLESRTFRIPRARLAGADVELHAYGRDTHMMTNDAVEASKVGRPPRPLDGGRAYVSRPFRSESSAEIQWKLNRVNYLSGLFIR